MSRRPALLFAFALLACRAPEHEPGPSTTPASVPEPAAPQPISDDPLVQALVELAAEASQVDDHLRVLAVDIGPRLTGSTKLAQAESSEHRLLYATAPLAEPLHISGTPRIKIKVAADKPAANLSVWLVQLPWMEQGKITDNIITRGWADPQNHASLTKGEPLVPGTFYELEFDLQPDDQLIAKGRRLGLMIFSSDRDFTLWPPAGTKLMVDLDATTLTLPVVGGATAFSKATSAGK